MYSHRGMNLVEGVLNIKKKQFKFYGKGYFPEHTVLYLLKGGIP